ncbi:MAG: hypothetical protein AAGA87_01035 [Pseudomonadota bacterium]
MTPETLAQVVAEANLAPSTHNTQPTQWRLDGDGLILSLNPQRFLPVGDPTNRDARLSMGAALYGTELALKSRGYTIRATEAADEVRLAFSSGEATPPERPITRRTSYRAGFSAPTDAQTTALNQLCHARDDAALTVDADTIEALARLNDATSLTIMRDRAFRDELRHWMRLKPSHPGWSQDGLSAEALAMSGIEALGAGIALSNPVFTLLDKIGLTKTITAEYGKTITSTGIVAFHRPEGEDRLTSGRQFYDLWLAFTEADLAAWPMAALADDPNANAEVCSILKIPENQILINVFRVGPHPGRAQPPKARLSPDKLIRP